jgi:glycosyltransferase involved in cell wall biosynthesis
MLRLRAAVRDADVRHYQWLPLAPLDALLLPPARPRVLTLHNVLRAERTERRLVASMDAVIVHTRAGAQLLAERTGIAPERIRVIPHGAFRHLAEQEDELPLPADLAAAEGPVVLCFGVVRPYKGVDVLLEAFRDVEAELWVVGRPLGESIERLRRLAPPGRVRFVPRYVPDRELPAYLRRADLLVLPHRRVDVSGVLAAGLAFAKPMVLSDAGGFREVVEEHGAGRLVPAGDPEALARAIRELLADPAERERLAAAARAAAAGPYSWERVAQLTHEVYEDVAA